MHIVLPDEPVGDHEIVDIAEDQRMLGRIAVFLLEKRYRVLAPVTAGIEMVRGVVAVVEAEAVTLVLLATLVKW
jgi:hypothetical protein